MSSEAARLAAYADLVAAVLDLRDPAPSQAFDDAVAAAVDGGALAPELARRLRWLQRETLRAAVEQARSVLPATLLALEQVLEAPSAPGVPGVPSQGPPLRAAQPSAEPAAQPSAESSAEPAAQPSAESSAEPAAQPSAESSAEPAPPVDLQARRLLVAGLRHLPDNPLPDGPRHGTLPSSP